VTALWLTVLDPTLAVYILGGTAAFCVTAFGLLYSATSATEKKGEDFYEKNLEACKKLTRNSRALLQAVADEATMSLDFGPELALFGVRRALERYRVHASATSEVTELKENYGKLASSAFWAWLALIVALFLIVAGIVAVLSGQVLLGGELIVTPSIMGLMVGGVNVSRWRDMEPKVRKARRELEDAIRAE
jgi:hypothetical protein